MKKLIFSLFALLLFSSHFLYSQSPNADTDLVWKFYPEGTISQMKLSPDNAVIVYGVVADTMFYFLNTETGNLIKSVRVKHGLDANAIAFSENYIAIGGNYNRKNDIYVDIYNNKTGDYLFSLTDSNLAFPTYYSFTNLCFSPDGKYLLANIDSNTNKLNVYLNKLYLWDLETKKVIKKIENVSFAGGIISQDSKYIAVRYNGKVGIFDYYTFKLIKTLEHGMNNLCFSPDGKYLATCASDGYIKIWDINNGFTLSKEYKCDVDNDLKHVKFINNSKEIIFGGGGGILLSVLNIENNKINKIYQDCFTFSGIDASSDNQFLYSVGGGKINKLKYSPITNVPSSLITNIIYPNPTSNILSIQTTCNLPIIQYSISNQIGQILVTNDVQNINNQIKIDFSQFSNGTYFLKFNCNENINNFKIIKE